MTCRAKYARITKALIRRKQTVTTMESCTAGTLSTLLTDTEGSSPILKGAFVTYSNEAKVACGVDERILSRYGVYSPQTARAMAEAAARAYGADFAIGVTGSLGIPDPANRGSIPGQVWVALLTPYGMDEMVWDDIGAPTRRQAKMMIAERVSDRILQILKENPL